MMNSTVTSFESAKPSPAIDMTALPEAASTIVADRNGSAAEDDGNWAILAGLRFFLATVVAFTHIVSVTPDAWNWLAIWIIFGPFQAVIGFFVISGYSIAASLERSTKGFYARRFWRLAPVYWFCFIYAQVPWWIAHTDIVTYPNGDRLGSILTQSHGQLICILTALCLQGLTTIAPSAFAQSWSLSCEVVYYIAAPFLKRISTRWIAAVGALSVCLYMWHGWNVGTMYALESHGWAVMCLAWAWLLGFLLYRYRQSERAWGLFVLALVALTSSSPTEPSTYGPITCAVVALGFSPWLKPLMAPQLTPRIRSGLLWLGEISYPLYLSHFTTIVLLGLYVHKASQMKADGDYIFYAATVAIAAAIYYLVDLPFRKLASWLKGRQAGQWQRRTAAG
jgi:peptidoglycan/LPS O-acetylase OafA/YrhL